MLRFSILSIFIAFSAVTPCALAADGSSQQAFDHLLERYQDLSASEFLEGLPPRNYSDGPEFDVTKAKYFDLVRKNLSLTDTEVAMLKKTGIVSFDDGRKHSMGSAYHLLWTKDLPVFVSSDSILNAMHRSYDEILKELETTFFSWTIDTVLRDSHQELLSQGRATEMKQNFADVDLYLTIARNLLAGAAAPKGPQEPANKRAPVIDQWNGRLLVKSHFAQDEKVMELLQHIQKGKMLRPMTTDQPVAIYGGERFFDFSQFKPRGHYTATTELKRYFRCMMWLGRADCGFNVLPPKLSHTSDQQIVATTDVRQLASKMIADQNLAQINIGIKADWTRELQNSVLLADVIRDAGKLSALKKIDEIIGFMIGKSDNLSIMQTCDLLDDLQIKSVADTADSERMLNLIDKLLTSNVGGQVIRSQILVSPKGPQKVIPPSTCQLFGQRFIVDSFALSHLVHDSIIYKGNKMERHMPTGLDVMATFGNDLAATLLSDELQQWQYAANLQACRQYVASQPAHFWNANLYNLWLNTLQSLDDDVTNRPNFPQAMKTEAWQRKQLQTQLASWAELRHDTLLYAKQSYGAMVSCEYPAGYIEPYPAFYNKVATFANRAAGLLKSADLSGLDQRRSNRLKQIQNSQVAFFKNMHATITTLQTMAEKELNAEPFSAEETAFIKGTIAKYEIDLVCATANGYKGWYSDLFYVNGGSWRKADANNAALARKWIPEIADVHTNPVDKSVLEVGTGNVNFMVVAVDNQDDHAVYVGPVYSYYEFTHPAEDRLTDEKWQKMLEQKNSPPRPTWTAPFQAPIR